MDFDVDDDDDDNCTWAGVGVREGHPASEVCMCWTGLLGEACEPRHVGKRLAGMFAIFIAVTWN